MIAIQLLPYSEMCHGLSMSLAQFIVKHSISLHFCTINVFTHHLISECLSHYM